MQVRIYYHDGKSYVRDLNHHISETMDAAMRSYDSGGTLEHLQEKVRTLSQTVASLVTILCEHGLVKFEDLSQVVGFDYQIVKAEQLPEGWVCPHGPHDPHLGYTGAYCVVCGVNVSKQDPNGRDSLGRRM